MNRRILFFAGLALLLAGGRVEAVVTYTLTDLTWGVRSWANAVNQSGQVAGYYATGYPTNRAFLWESSSGTRELREPGSAARAYDINGSGYIAGYCKYGVDTAALWHDPTQDPEWLGTLGGTESWAYALNESNQVVGSARTAAGAKHACLWDGGAITDLGTLGGGESWAYGINESAQIVGSAAAAGNWQHAFLWEAGVMQDLGTLGGYQSRAYDINDAGHVVGRANNDPNRITYHAVAWDSAGTIQDLATLPGHRYSEACAINNSGQIVGWSGLYYDSPERAILYENGTMYDLNDLVADLGGWTLYAAYGISDSGHIVGFGSNGTADHAFLLSPPAPVIPEPASVTVWILLGALAALLGWRRTKAAA